MAYQTLPDIGTILGDSGKISELRAQIARLARARAPVYISGESGSGKELAARAIHGLSPRRDCAFVAVNCGAIPAELVESELFGHLKGSFTGATHDKQGLFQAANGGTLLLDEVADLPPQTQVKLLRVIQEKRIRPVGSQREVAVDVRLLSATHKVLAQEVALGRLRQDLYYRINVIELAVPGLRERAEDIPQLAEHILRRIAAENDMPVCQLGEDALALLQAYRFPGNVRELQNILQRTAALCEGGLIGGEQLAFLGKPEDEMGAGNVAGVMSATDVAGTGAVSMVGATDVAGAGATPHLSAANHVRVTAASFSLDKYLHRIEATIIKQTMEATRWNKTAAAKKLGVSFRSLRYRLQKLDME